MKKKAIVITDNIIDTNFAKTAHGFIRGSDRFEIVAVIDEKYAGIDAGEFLDGNHRNIPILATVSEAISIHTDIEFLIIGVANLGGVLSDSLLQVIRTAIPLKLTIVNGLHHLLENQSDIVALAKKHQVNLIDIRKPKELEELHFWTQEVFKINVPVIAVLGMDCAIGKRTVTRLLCNDLEKVNLKAEIIYTGQTGWMQGSKYGFIFDATRNDFVSGELVHAMLTCWKNETPDVLLLEGQSSLRNPSGPCGLELIISGNAKQVILVHAPARRYFDDDESWGEIPSVESEIDIIKKFVATVIGIALNTKGLNNKETLAIKKVLEESLNIPVVNPLDEGMQRIVSVIKF